MAKSFIFLVKSVLGNFYRNLAIFIWSHWVHHPPPPLREKEKCNGVMSTKQDGVGFVLEWESEKENVFEAVRLWEPFMSCTHPSWATSAARVNERERERERVSVRRRNQFCKQGGVFLCLWSPSVSAYRGVSVSKLLWDFYGSTDDTLWTFRTPRSCTYLMLLGIYFLSNIAWFLTNKNVQRLNRWRRV